MLSIIIPAHNEQAVIRRCLTALLSGAAPGELEVIVVCNACTDRTAQIAREFGAPVRVLESEIASKSNALNLGDQAATGFPRFYLDADILVSLESIRRMTAALKNGPALAAAPAVDTQFPEGTTWAVRAYYRFWMALPYVQEGMMAAGVYAVTEAGRRRFTQFPDVIADDGYFRMLFGSRERMEVKEAISTVWAPGCLADLIRIKTRSRLGFYQLKTRFPDAWKQEAQSKNYGSALASILAQPSLWPCAVPYVWVNLVSRLRARRQLADITAYVWERDGSSRQQPAPCAP